MTNNPYGGVKLRRAFMHFATGKSIGAAIGIGWLLLLVRELSLSDYGIYVTFTAYLNIFVVVGSFGLIPIAERYVPELRVSSSSHTLISLLIKIVMARLVLLVITCLGVSFFSASISSSLITTTDVSTAFIIFQLVVFGEALCRYIEIIFDSLLHQKYSQISTIFRYGLRFSALIASAFFFENELDLFTWIVIEAVCMSLGCVLTLMLMWRVVYKLRDGESVSDTVTEDKLEYRRYIRYSAPTYFSRIVASLSGIEMAKLVVVRLLGLEAAAVFSFCASLAVIFQRYLPSFLLMSMVRPLFITALQADNPEKRLNFLFSIMIKLNVFLILPVLSVMTVIGGQVIDVLSNHKIIGGGLITVFLLGFVMTQAVRIAYSMILASLEDGKGSLVSMLIAAALFYTSILFVPSIGSFALIIGLILADFSVMAIAKYRINIKSYRLGFPFVGIGKLLIVTAVTTLFISAIISSLSTYGQYGQIFVVGLVVIVLYPLLAWLISPFSQEERSAINRMLPIRVFVW
ncbi:MAG: oligosaccharide flippase family protein [Thiotrichaceae bacterium]|nr:oligosaccharide flippase family protein [Thiotrichaceae bacterium]PCI12191.1 MAG: hypothetical protein COB71_10050 [Thiotrichales bacterium]